MSVMLNQLARYAPVAERLPTRTDGRLLDVGAGSEGIAPWLPRGWSATALDSRWDDYGNARGDGSGSAARVTGDARSLPFPDASFDAVVCLDVIEHIPPADRPRVLDELRRVCAGRLLVACPTGAPALEADRLLEHYYRGRAADAPGWLAEHLSHGLPESEELAAAGRSTDHVELLGLESIRAHLIVSRMESRLATAAALGALARLLAPALAAGRARDPRRWILRALRGRDRQPTYRTLVVVDVG
jgi:SAM-dependent methyltransferase